MMKLISVSNPGSVGYDFLNVVSTFSYDGNIFYFSAMHSSTVKSITRTDDELTVVTRNTTYIFQDH